MVQTKVVSHISPILNGKNDENDVLVVSDLSFEQWTALIPTTDSSDSHSSGIPQTIPIPFTNAGHVVYSEAEYDQKLQTLAAFNTRAMLSHGKTFYEQHIANSIPEGTRFVEGELRHRTCTVQGVSLEATQYCNMKYRSHQEDTYFILPGKHFGDISFGLLDGHGSYPKDRIERFSLLEMLKSEPVGECVSIGIAACIQRKLRDYLPRYTTHDALYRAITETDWQLSSHFPQTDATLSLSKAAHYGGATAVVGVIEENVLYVHNVGDSRLVVVDKDHRVQPLTLDHRTSVHPYEAQRVQRVIDSRQAHQKENGYIYYSGFGIEVSRVIGDHRFPRDVISSEPDMYTYTVQDDDRMILAATDGFWSVVGLKDLETIIRDCPPNEALNHHLVKEAVLRGSSDNISVLSILIS